MVTERVGTYEGLGTMRRGWRSEDGLQRGEHRKNTAGGQKAAEHKGQ